MLQLQLLKLFAFGVKIYSANFSLDLVEADVVETFERGPSDGSNAVVRDQEMLFPPHKDVVSLRKVSDGHWALSSHLLVRPKGAKLGPMAEIDFGIGAPVIMLGKEIILGTDDFSLKVGGECWVVFGQSLNTQVAAEERFAQVNMFDLNLDLVDLSFGLLRAAKLASGSEE